MYIYTKNIKYFLENLFIVEVRNQNVWRSLLIFCQNRFFTEVFQKILSGGELYPHWKMYCLKLLFIYAFLASKLITKWSLAKEEDLPQPCANVEDSFTHSAFK